MKLLLATILLISALATAHSGRTDSSGGHNNHKTGGYHYHNSGHSKSSYSSKCHYVDDDYGNYAYVTESGSSCNSGSSKSKKPSKPGFFGSLINEYFDNSNDPVPYFNIKIPACNGGSLKRAACKQAISEGRYIRNCEKDSLCRRMYPNNLKAR